MTEQWSMYLSEIARLASWMADNGHSAQEVAYMVEKPWKFEEEYAAMEASSLAEEQR